MMFSFDCSLNCRMDEKLGLSHLPRLFSSCMQCLLSDKPEVAEGATRSMKVRKIHVFKYIYIHAAFLANWLNMNILIETNYMISISV